MSDGLKGSYEVAVGKRAIYVRVHGLGSMTNCLCVRDFLDDMLSSNRGFIVFDLQDCTGMDSTFMGVMAGVATFHVDEHTAGVAVVNAGKPLVKLLKSVGLNELVFIERDAFETPDIEFHVLEEKATEEERLKLIRSAHEHLVNISDENEKLFGDLIRALETEMKKRGMIE